jgi:hypothetical protein
MAITHLSNPSGILLLFLFAAKRKNPLLPKEKAVPEKTASKRESYAFRVP